jgi:aryl-alcohol dehydrogenase-like predicted oxidoreductase
MQQGVSPPARQLDRTDMCITRVGFGSWAVGGDWAVGWGSQDGRDSIAAIRRTMAPEVNWVDTAASYRLGHFAEIVPAACSTIPPIERPYIFTKCGLLPDRKDRNATPKDVGDPVSPRRQIGDQLRRLQTATLSPITSDLATIAAAIERDGAGSGLPGSADFCQTPSAHRWK